MVAKLHAVEGAHQELVLVLKAEPHDGGLALIGAMHATAPPIHGLEYEAPVG
jgi:hypothetical protein